MDFIESAAIADVPLPEAQASPPPTAEAEREREIARQTREALEHNWI